MTSTAAAPATEPATAALPPSAAAVFALLRAVEQKCEAVAAILVDRRCAPTDAIPLLHLGWKRMLDHAARERGALEPGPELLAPPGVVDVTVWRALVERLRSETARLEHDDAPTALSRRELGTLNRMLRAAVKAARAQAEARYGREPRPWGARVARAAVVMGLLGVSGGVAAMVWEDKPVETGWRGSYYKNEKFEGSPVLRKDPEVAFLWDHAKPMPEIGNDRFSVRWDGCLRVKEPGKYTFSIGSDDGSRLHVDGTKLIENWGTHGVIWKDGSVDLGVGLHHLQVEYYEVGGPASMLMKMGRDGAPLEPVPVGDVVLPGEDPNDPCKL